MLVSINGRHVPAGALPPNETFCAVPPVKSATWRFVMENKAFVPPNCVLQAGFPPPGMISSFIVDQRP